MYDVYETQWNEIIFRVLLVLSQNVIICAEGKTMSEIIKSQLNHQR